MHLPAKSIIQSSMPLSIFLECQLPSPPLPPVPLLAPASVDTVLVERFAGERDLFVVQSIGSAGIDSVRSYDIPGHDWTLYV